MNTKSRHHMTWLLVIVLLVSIAATTVAFANIMGEYNIDDSGAISLINESASESASDVADSQGETMDFSNESTDELEMSIKVQSKNARKNKFSKNA